MKRIFFGFGAALIVTMMMLVFLIYYFASHESVVAGRIDAPDVNHAGQVARGRYLAQAGDCMACHTVRGGRDYAGGRVIATPFGDMVSPNITSDVKTGIGSWGVDDFWHALHNGKSKDGRLLYPAFPYTNYTKITRGDADALFAYFQTVPAVSQVSLPHQLRFPYNQGIMLAAWRALYFRPGVFQPEHMRGADWNRGAYLVQGLGHCNACHTNRNALGASDTRFELAGGQIPIMNWYAPSLTSDAEAGLGKWETHDIGALLQTGISQQGAVFGPMAEVVSESLQHLSGPDIAAMAVYLKALPQTALDYEEETAAASKDGIERVKAQGAKLYETHCQDCHQANGKGLPPAYPPLAGNRAITMQSAVNPIRMVLNGGFPPGTHANPRPYGMPPYGPLLNDAEVAAVVTYIRHAWGNGGTVDHPLGLVYEADVNRYRAVPLD
jgi:mono/diheme cytochrome c family protein